MEMSLIISKSDPENPSVEEILSVEKYVSGYACKGNQPTGAVVDLFNDLVNCADESTGATAKSICTKLLVQTVKRYHLNYRAYPYTDVVIHLKMSVCQGVCC